MDDAYEQPQRRLLTRAWTAVWQTHVGRIISTVKSGAFGL